MLKSLKTTILKAGRDMGLVDFAAGTRWRRNRLLILCYHGVSLDDEHRWNPYLYVSPATLRNRLELLRRSSFSLLALDDAVARLAAGTLPPRAVTITFDDGHYDFLHVAMPLLREFDVPATVYLTTYHVDHNVPIFALVVSYMLWKAGNTRIDLSHWGGQAHTLLGTREANAAALDVLVGYAADARFSSDQKSDLARDIADVLGIDWADVRARRLLHLLNAEEVRDLAARGVDFQLHTHRHRSPRTESAYRDELQRNRQRVIELTGRNPVHFCYPSGVHSPAFLPWLRAEGIASATTCVPGLAEPATDPLLLPRLLDHEKLAPIEFETWAAGVGALLPSRPATRLAATPSLD